MLGVTATSSPPPTLGTAVESSQSAAVPSVASDDTTEIHVLGFTITRREAPWDRWQEPGVEIWGINNLHIAQGDIPVERCHRWFDLHPHETILQDQAHVEWMKQQSRPMYVFSACRAQLAEIGVQHLREFPVDMLCDAYDTRYFTNSISWLLAFAGLVLQPALDKRLAWEQAHQLAERAETPLETVCDRLGIPVEEPQRPVIGVWGVDMATGTEYGAQRPSCEYFIGLLRGAGFDIRIPAGSDLLKTAGLYGSDDNGQLRAKLIARRLELNQQIEALQAERTKLVNQQGQIDGRIAHLQGAATDCTYWLDRWTMPEIDRNAASNPGQV